MWSRQYFLENARANNNLKSHFNEFHVCKQLRQRCEAGAFHNMYAILLERKEPKNLHIAKIMETPDTLQHAFTCTINTQFTNAIQIRYRYIHIHAQTLAPAGRVHEKAFPHFHTDQIIHRSSPEKEMQPKTRFSFQERTTTWTYAVCICTFPPTAIFHFSFTRCRSSCRAATGTASTRA